MHPHRRRKKRPNYGIKTVDVFRGSNGFGFTISGQQPCILSSIVQNSPADLAGLRSGDFLISVNGLNVSKHPHENVVSIIGNSTGRIRMAIAENYYSDSSDEDILMHQNQARVRLKYPNTKSKPNRTVPRSSMDKLTDRYNLPFHCPSAALASHNVIHSPNATNTPDIKNVSAMVRKSDLDNLPSASSVVPSAHSMSLEYRVIVGYLGTIEMPKQIATSSKLQTVRSCIRKMRQEKRNPTVVLMKILPSCLNLLNSSNILLATYPSTRLNYVSSSSDNNNNKFFGLVTSAIYAEGMPIDSLDSLCTQKDIIISNSCHVFVIDTKLMDHNVHLPKADKFQIACTRDPISNLCLEFPNNSEYIVNLIRSMYSLKSPIKFENGPRNRPAAMRNLHLEQQQRRRNQPDQHDMQNSPQPSNHSEITTTSSNSDSGIGFHNDYANISDRILVVDFPGLRRVPRQLPPNFQRANRPYAIHNDNQLENLNLIRNIRSMGPMPSTSGIGAENCGQGTSNISHTKSKSADYSPEVRDHLRLAIRAMPDPIVCEKNYENYPQSPIEDSW